MAPYFSSVRSLSALLTAALLLVGCSKKSDDIPAPVASGGTVVWTLNGQTYTSTTYSGAVVDTGDRISVVGSPDDKNTVISLKLEGINAKGVGTYPLVGAPYGTAVSSVDLYVDKNTATTRGYTTNFGSGASNGSIVVTQYDRANQKLAGTFSFVAHPLLGTGDITVTNGRFNITKFD